MSASIDRARSTMKPARGVAILIGLVIALAELAAGGVALADDGHYPHRLSRRPRHPRDPQPRVNQRRGDAPENFVQLKFGTFDPEGRPGDGGFFGLGTGVEFEKRLAAGFALDYYRRSFTDEVIIAETVDENGNVITTSARRLETSSNLIPLGVNLSLRLPGSHHVTPFIGVGVAYEILVNEVRNYEQGIEDTSVYAGPGWQLFGGLLLPVTSEVNVLGELWANDATVRRDIDRYEQGLPVTERIDVDGFGARVGIEFHFD